MKRYGYIWDNFCSVANAEKAIELGTAKKRKSYAVRRWFGYNRKAIEKNPELRHQLDPAKVHARAEKIVALLESGQWKPQPYRHIQKCSETNGKIREIDCPALQDHIVHWMLILSIKEAITRGMYKFTVGSVPGRGIEYGRKAIEKWIRERDSVYHVKLDVRKFYPNIDHGIMKESLRRILKDERVLAIADAVIDSLPKGLAIGTYSSQWFGNLYLQPLDHFIMEQNHKLRRGKRVNYVKHMLRNMDDVVLIGSSRRDLEKAVRATIKFAKEKLKLEIKSAWEISRFDERPLDVLGYRFTKETTTLRKVIFLHTKRNAKKIYKIKQKYGVVWPHDAQAMESRLGWADHADDKQFRKLYIDPYIDENEILEVIRSESKKQCPARVPCSS